MKPNNSSSENSSRCSQFNDEQLIDYCLGEFATKLQNDLPSHLQQCSVCKKRYEYWRGALEKSSSLVNAAPGLETPAVHKFTQPCNSFTEIKEPAKTKEKNPLASNKLLLSRLTSLEKVLQQANKGANQAITSCVADSRLKLLYHHLGYLAANELAPLHQHLHSCSACSKYFRLFRPIARPLAYLDNYIDNQLHFVRYSNNPLPADHTENVTNDLRELREQLRDIYTDFISVRITDYHAMRSLRRTNSNKAGTTSGPLTFNQGLEKLAAEIEQQIQQELALRYAESLEQSLQQIRQDCKQFTQQIQQLTSEMTQLSIAKPLTPLIVNNQELPAALKQFSHSQSITTETTQSLFSNANTANQEAVTIATNSLAATSPSATSNNSSKIVAFPAVASKSKLTSSLPGINQRVFWSAAAILVIGFNVGIIKYWQTPSLTSANNLPTIQELSSPLMQPSTVSTKEIDSFITEIETALDKKDPDTTTAQQLIPAALAQSKSLNYYKGEARLTYLQGRFYSEKGEYNQAIAILEEAAKLGRQFQQEQPELVTRPLLLTTKLYHALDQNTAAAQSARACWEILQHTENSPPKISCLQYLALSEFLAYQSEESEEMLQQSRAIAEKIGRSDYVIQSLRFSGIIKTEKGDTDTASRFFEEALAITNNIKDANLQKYLKGGVIAHYARSQAVANANEEAIKLYQQAIALSSQLKDVSAIVLSQLHQGLGECYSRENNETLASASFEKAKGYEEQAHNTCHFENTAMSVALVRKRIRTCD
jgi:tetratricopeptide (TPR) repeat protein